MTRPSSVNEVDLSLDCEEHGHVFGLITGNVRHCMRHGCSWRDAYDPDDFVTADGDLYDFDDPDRAELAYCADDAYVVRRPADPLTVRRFAITIESSHPHAADLVREAAHKVACEVDWGDDQTAEILATDNTSPGPPRHLASWSMEPGEPGRPTPPLTVAEAEASGFTVDRHCYPWVAYKGPRFAPTVSFPVATPAT